MDDAGGCCGCIVGLTLLIVLVLICVKVVLFTYHGLF